MGNFKNKGTGEIGEHCTRVKFNAETGGHGVISPWNEGPQAWKTLDAGTVQLWEQGRCEQKIAMFPGNTGP